MERSNFYRVEVRAGNGRTFHSIRYYPWLRNEEEAMSLLMGVMYGFSFGGNETELDGYVYDKSGKVIYHIDF